MKKAIVTGLFATLVTAPFLVLGAGWSFDAQRGGIATMGTPKGNMYAAGGTVVIGEATAGDLMIAGGNILVNSTVGVDLTAAGGHVSVVGNVGDDVRVAGGSVIISGNVGGEAVLAAGQIDVAPSSTIKNDLIAIGSEVNVNGNVNGGVNIRGGKVYLNGVVGKDVEVRASQTLVIGKDARIEGTLTYSAPNEAQMEEGAVIKGKVSFTKIEQPQATSQRVFAFVGAWWFIKLIILLVSALVLFFLLRKRVQEFVDRTMEGFGKELLRGFVLLVMIPILIVLLFITVLGALFGLLGIAFYLLFIGLGCIFSAILFGVVLKKLLRIGSAGPLSWPTVVLGVVATEIIGLIPFIGWIVHFVFFLAAFGALLYGTFERVRT